MNQQFYKTGFSTAGLLLASFYLTGCGSSSSSMPLTPPALASYEVTVVNATSNQPLSPVAVITHSAAYAAWDVGSAASVAMENLAEGGSNSQLLAALSVVDAASASGTGVIAPGGNEKIMLTVTASRQTLITVASMLVNTNDAFAGLRSIDVSALASGDSMTVNANVYDVGTELNSESSGTMPGPADGGEVLMRHAVISAMWCVFMVAWLLLMMV